VLLGLLVVIWLGFALYTLPLLITLLGAYILIDGIVTIVAGTRDSGGAGGIIARRNQKWTRSG
jgi:uncharacterized membrane protein HdeD (DUF308 family)